MTDENKGDEFTPEAFVKMLRRQIAELETVRVQLLRSGENPDDNEQLRDALLEIQSFRKMLAAMEDELQGGSTDEGQNDD